MEFDDTKPKSYTKPPQSGTGTMKSDVKAAASEIASETRQKTSETFSENREQIAKNVEGLAHAADVAAEDLQEHHQQALSEYVTQFASGISELAENLRHKSIDELIHEAEGVARRNPALFIGASIAIGLGLARFAKASSHRPSHDTDTRHTQSTQVPADASLTSGYSTRISTEQDTTYKGNGSTLSGGAI
jgi:exonuclease VII large subunit